jgi:molybdopterin/thiamine biosynthesis adenylyltransferase/rhodanese-related sulfurtransferase
MSLMDIDNPSLLYRRYSRQMSLPDVGASGQTKLANSSVLVVGAGGLGSPVLQYLAGAGIGHIGICDFDTVDISNLHRQLIHFESSLGLAKVISAKQFITSINSTVRVTTYDCKVTSSNILELVRDFDCVCDCTDNFTSRYLVNDACVLLNKPLFYGSVFQFEGQVSSFNLSGNSPNYRDLVSEPPPPEFAPSCSEAGVLGILPGIIGLIQSTEILKYCLNLGNPLDGILLTFNALDMSFNKFPIIKDPFTPPITSIQEVEIPTCSLEVTNDSSAYITVNDFISAHSDQNSSKKYLFVDVRSPHEYNSFSIPGSLNIPLDDLEQEDNIDFFSNNVCRRSIVFICKSGLRSTKAVNLLSKYDIQSLSLDGGIDSWLNSQPI